MVRPNRGTAKLLALLADDEEKFITKVRGVLEEKGNYPDAADALDVPARTLRRWAEEFPAIVKGLELRGPGKPRG